ncbi:MAG: caspase family protein [Acidimicrobiales bacterium]
MSHRPLMRTLTTFTSAFLLLAGMALAPTSPGGPGPTPASAQPSGPGPENRWALLVGVDRFLGPTRPNFGAVNDVIETRRALLEAGWLDDHIKVVTDASATAEGIRAGLAWLVERSSPSTLNVFHYSGHVRQAQGVEFLWPHDNRFIRDTELASQLTRLAGRSWINISGCEAAGFDEGVSGPARLFTASSRSTEKSYELVSARNSVFTLLMVKQGILQRLADSDSDGTVSVQEAFAYAAARAPGITASAPDGPQNPVIAGGDGSPFLLNPQASSPPAGVAAACRLNLLGLCLLP